MSTLRTQPLQVAEFLNSAPRMVERSESSLETAQGSARSDDRMMFPWSIGTTRAAKERAMPRRKEECPPEVYIG